MGEGKLQENFEKDSLFHDSLCTDNLFSPQIFTEERREWGRGRGGSVHKLFYEGAQKLEKVMNTIMNTEIMNTFPKTFVQIVAILKHVPHCIGIPDNSSLSEITRKEMPGD